LTPLPSWTPRWALGHPEPTDEVKRLFSTALWKCVNADARNERPAPKYANIYHALGRIYFTGTSNIVSASDTQIELANGIVVKVK
jgi:hypothetical protein